jgi:hypothetical protein
VLAEFGQDTLVLVVDKNGRVTQQGRVADFLPGAFTPSDLPGIPQE